MLIYPFVMLTVMEQPYTAFLRPHGTVERAKSLQWSHCTPPSKHLAELTLHDASADDTSHVFLSAKRKHQHDAEPLGAFAEHSAKLHRDTDLPSPITRIPIELLGEIFTQCLSPESLYLPRCRPRLTSMSSSFSPLTLSHVCVYWRNVSHSMAKLWSAIEIRRPNLSMIPVIRLWLQRAADCPLSIRMLQGHDMGHAEHAATERVLPLLIERIHLWKSIDFQFSTGPYKSLLDLSEGAAGMLESALLDLRDWDHASADQLWRIFHASPTLRQADWFGFDEPELPSHAPWSQLTHITISRIMTEGEVLELIKACPAVINLNLPFLDPSPTPVERACIVLPNLHTLTFATSTPDYGTMFDGLILPALACLDVTHPCSLSPIGAFSFIEGLLGRSFCRLQKFTFCDWNMDEELLLDILALPNLRYLSELELMACITDRTALALTHHGDDQQSCLLPHLKVMTIRESHASDSVLSNMATSRLPILKTLRLDYECQ